MKNNFFLSCILVLVGYSTYSKSLPIYIKENLDSAKLIKNVIIHSYTDSFMICVHINSNDTLKIPSWDHQSTEAFRDTLIKDGIMKSSDYGMSWPKIGEEILIVLGPSPGTLFARRIDNDYRFWNPNFQFTSLSVFVIPKIDGFNQLLQCKASNPNFDYLYCGDGCLVSVSLIKERG